MTYDEKTDAKTITSYYLFGQTIAPKGDDTLDGFFKYSTTKTNINNRKTLSTCQDGLLHVAVNSKSH